MALTRRLFAKGLASFAAWGARPPGVHAADLGHEEPEEPWNILYISSDQHNPRFTSHERHPLARTPHIDRLASQGVRCANTYVATPVCAPTRQSWLTGLYAQEHGQLGNHYSLDPRTRSLVEVFRDAGYTTACFGKLHTETVEENGTYGWDVVLNQRRRDVWREISREHQGGTTTQPWYDPKDAPIFDSIPNHIPFKGRVKPHLGFCDDYVLAHEASRFIRDSLNRPFFAYVSMRLPHYPFDLPEEYYHRYSPSSLGPLDEVEMDWSTRLGGAIQMLHYSWRRLTPEQSALLTARYLGAVALIDDLVGMLLDALDRAGLAKRTIVVYASDHGDMVGQKGLWLKHVLYEGAARKPFIVRMPGVLPRGGTWEGLWNDTDILPTLAGLVGLGGAMPRDISGHDFSQALLKNEPSSPVTFAVDHITPELETQMLMVRTPRYKTLLYPAHGNRPAQAELYDLLTDPDEDENLAADPAFSALIAEHTDIGARFLARRRPPTYPVQLLVKSSDPE